MQFQNRVHYLKTLYKAWNPWPVLPGSASVMNKEVALKQDPGADGEELIERLFVLWGVRWL